MTERTRTINSKRYDDDKNKIGQEQNSLGCPLLQVASCFLAYLVFTLLSSFEIVSGHQDMLSPLRQLRIMESNDRVDERYDPMHSLTADTLLYVLSFLNAADLEAVSLTSRSLSHASKSGVLWEELCRYTGKIASDLSSLAAKLRSKDFNFFFRLYHNVPCVPVDFGSLREALEISPPGTTITVRPGVYEERLVIDKSVRIRASDPVRGAAIVWYQACHKHSQESCSCHRHQDESLVEVEESCTYVYLRNLTLLHYSEGTNVWNGNCAVYCHGDLTHTCLEECSIQSDSGRGIVVSNGAGVILVRSSIHDCAATGVYVGGEGSSVDIVSSNIIRNGFGRRPLQDPVQERIRTPGIREGHSGLYVEDGDAEIRNTLIAGNCLTGLSVVRSGSLHICHNTFVGNGADPVVVFQDERSEDDDDDESVGTVSEYSNIFEVGSPTPEEMEATMIRCPTVWHHPLSRVSLLDLCEKALVDF